MLKIINPATEAVIREIPTDTPESIRAHFERAKAAQPAWAARPLSERIAILTRFRDKIIEHANALANQLSDEMGKPRKQALNEIRALPDRIDFFLQHTEATLRTQDVSLRTDPNTPPATQELISYEPLGVIANISAWNYPYFVGSNVFVPALLTGNAVLYKPSEYTPLTGLSIAQLLHEAGVPKDIFVTILGTGAAGAALTALPIHGVFFTGSYATGVKIAQAVAARLIKVQLELGGKDPAYVCEDADPKNAAIGLADGAFYNAGQSCCSVERIYVHQANYDAFVDAFVEEVKGFNVGDPTKEDTYIGPLARKEQLDVLDAQVQDALQKGARLLLGGHRLEGTGYYYAPTVLVDVDHSMEVMREESFGPIIGIQKVRDDQDAIEKMNDTAFGLTAGVYTQDASRAKSVLAHLNAGSAYWNCCDRVSPRLPWTGRQHSGIGSTLSHLGILAFVQPKAWHLRSPA